MIVDLAERFIVQGTANGQLNPDQAITRAEFAAMVVRALIVAVVFCRLTGLRLSLIGCLRKQVAKSDKLCPFDLFQGRVMCRRGHRSGTDQGQSALSSSRHPPTVCSEKLRSRADPDSFFPLLRSCLPDQFHQTTERFPRALFTRIMQLGTCYLLT